MSEAQELYEQLLATVDSLKALRMVQAAFPDFVPGPVSRRKPLLDPAGAAAINVSDKAAKQAMAMSSASLAEAIRREHPGIVAMLTRRAAKIRNCRREYA